MSNSKIVLKDDCPWYIHDQVWRVLTLGPEDLARRGRRDAALRGYLEPEHMRPGRILETGDVQAHDRAWGEVDREAVALGRVRDANGFALDCRLTAITSDAGMGKSAATEWLEYRMNHPAQSRAKGAEVMAFHFDIQAFAQAYRKQNEDLVSILCKQWVEACQTRQPIDKETAKRCLRAFLRRGEVCLILDGLDQAAQADVNIVTTVVGLPECNRCRFVLAGRPNGILSHWNDLFADREWTFIKVDDFSRSNRSATWVGCRRARSDSRRRTDCVSGRSTSTLDRS